MESCLVITKPHPDRWEWNRVSLLQNSGDIEKKWIKILSSRRVDDGFTDLNTGDWGEGGGNVFCFISDYEVNGQNCVVSE